MHLSNSLWAFQDNVQAFEMASIYDTGILSNIKIDMSQGYRSWIWTIKIIKAFDYMYNRYLYKTSPHLKLKLLCSYLLELVIHKSCLSIGAHQF